MSENGLQIMAICKLLWVTSFAGLYGFGGIKRKWLRRFVGSVWMGIGVYGFSSWSQDFHFWYLLYPILLCISLHLGYGGDDFATKFRKRALYGLLLGISAVPLVFGLYLWSLFSIHVCLCVLVSTIFGVFNPTKNARDEETIISALSTVIPLFLI